MKTRRTFFQADKILIFGALIGISVAIYNLYLNKEESTHSSGSLGTNGVAIGQVVPMGSDVRYKSISSSGWQGLRHPQSVGEADRIYAGEDSRARIDLDSGARIYVSPSSLVTVSKIKNDRVMEIESGSLISNLLQNGKILIKQNNTLTEIVGRGKVLIKKSVDKIQVQLLSGEVTLKTPETEQKMVAEEVWEMDKDAKIVAKTSPKFKLMAPIGGASLWLKSQEAVRFQWEGENVGSKVRLSVATSPEFTKDVISLEVAANEATLNLNPLTQYYWKVESGTGADSVTSATGVFFTWKKEGPKLMTAPQDLVAATPFRVFWTDSADSMSYKVEIYNETDLHTAVYSAMVSTTDAEVTKGLEAGSYQWRVTSQRADREDFVSEMASFHVAGPQPRLTAPRWEKPEIKYELYQTSNFDAEFRCEGCLYTDAVEIKGDAGVAGKTYEWKWSAGSASNVSPEIFQSQVPDLKIQKNLSPGLYYLQMRYQGENQEWSEWSETLKVQVLLAPPKLNVPVTGEEKAQLTWTPLKGIAKYQVSVAPQRNFSNAQVSELENTVYDLMDAKPGNYFFRVRAMTSKGWPVSRWSRVQKFSVKEKAVPQPLELVLRQPAAAAEPSHEVGLTGIIPPTEKKSSTQKLNLWFGAGAHYLRFSQADSSGDEGGTFAAITSPTSTLKAGYQWNDQLGFEMSYSQMPGKINPAGFSVNKGNYTWSILGFEAQKVLGEGLWNSRWTLLAGAQRHETPFLTSGQDADVEVLQNNLLTGSLGVKADLIQGQDWRYEVLVRYQHPLASTSTGGDFKTTGGFSFDGSIGVSKNLSKSWKIGLFYFGQSHKWNYAFVPSDNSGARNGTQTLLNSDMQVRVGYEWYFGQFLYVISNRRRRRRRDKET